MSKEGITAGLTNTNTASMNFARLNPSRSSTQHGTDLNTIAWPELPACLKITVPGVAPAGPAPCEDSTALLDLGVGVWSGFGPYGIPVDVV